MTKSPTALLVISTLFLDTTEHLEERAHGFHLDTILDSVELATEGRSFTNLNGFREHYLLITLNHETWGVGVRLAEDTLNCTTLLTPRMVTANEHGGSHLPPITAFKVA